MDEKGNASQRIYDKGNEQILCNNFIYTHIINGQETRAVFLYIVQHLMGKKGRIAHILYYIIPCLAFPLG